MNQSENTKICPVCQFENETSAQQCQRCKAPLSSGITTLAVPAASEHPVINESQESLRLKWARTGTIALHVVGQSQPLILKDMDEIVIGRRVAGEPPPTVDLTEYHAHLLGVSRRHAMIRSSVTGYTIEDLNSNNGTWINEERLPANTPQLLKTGDQLRLGQLTLFIYFPTLDSLVSNLP
jgi:pSer/pThr/pTyr-binding forkhead associated (FHA) protein